MICKHEFDMGDLDHNEEYFHCSKCGCWFDSNGVKDVYEV